MYKSIQAPISCFPATNFPDRFWRKWEGVWILRLRLTQLTWPSVLSQLHPCRLRALFFLFLCHSVPAALPQLQEVVSGGWSSERERKRSETERGKER